METTSVDLGFLEPCEPWLLTNKFFRSKVGGKPAWLELKSLPKPDDLLCGQCKEPLGFLCQSAVKSPVPLCVVCGCRGPKLCSRCKSINYCSASHQKLDWKVGHKSVCSEEGITASGTPSGSSSILFPEFEIITEAEEYEPKAKLSEEENMKRQMAELERLKQEGKAGTLDELPEAELDKYSADQLEDKTFDKFKERISEDPEQVLRYERGGKPLWLSPVVPKNIPVCERCTGPRVFEFQIMPQMLNSLNNDQLDWGTLVCYTCEASCDVEGYTEEFVFRQDVLNTDTAKE
uniref:MYND-type domain-containing protein n=1 Tax=Anopheles minimus TaxID=112268 RepID=A0A182WKG6_9DIPT